MCNITDNFYEDLIFDLEYQEYLYNKNLQNKQQYDEYFEVELMAYDKMAEQYFNELSKYELATLKKK